MMTRRACWALIPALAVVVGVAEARADQIAHPSGFTFALPDIGKSWEQEPKGDLYLVADENSGLPELQMFVFPPRKEGTLAEIQARLPDEVKRPGVAIVGEAAKTFKVIDAKPETIADASAVIGTAMFNRDKAAFAIVQRGAKSLIVIGVPDGGKFDRGMSNLRAVVRGLKPIAGAKVVIGGGAGVKPPSAKVDLPVFPAMVGVREVTATSTFADKRNAYAAWRTIAYGQEDRVNDEGEVEETVLTSAWCEGKSDEGVGETVTVALTQPTKIDAIKIAAGVWKSSKLFGANNQITSLEVSLDGKPTTVTVPAKREWVTVTASGAVSTIAIKIAAVKKGKMNDSCLSAIQLVRGDEPMSAVIADGQGVNLLTRSIATIQVALSPEGRYGLEAMIEVPFSNHDAAGFAMGAPKAVKHTTWKSIAAACKAWDKAVENDSVDERKPIACPRPVEVDTEDTRPAGIVSTGPGLLEISFPSHNEAVPVWRLHWVGGVWKLAAIDYH